MTGARAIVSQDSSAATLSPLQLPAIGWTKGIAPRFIALFLLLVFYDRLAIRTLLVGGLIPTTIGVILGGLLAYLLFFRPSALWSLHAREPVERLAGHTFGALGSALVMRLVLALTLIVWFAVLIQEAVDITAHALMAFGFVAFTDLAPRQFAGMTIPSPVCLWVAGIWSVASALIGSLAYKLVAAVMSGYQPFVGLALAILMAWGLPTAPQFVPLGYDPTTMQIPASPFWFALVQSIQWVCSFFAISAALGGDWGMASRDRRDIEMGGLTGIAVAAPVLSILALLFVAGALGRSNLSEATTVPLQAHRGYQLSLDGQSQISSNERDRQAATLAGTKAFSVSAIVQNEFPAYPAGLLLLVFAVGMLGPACFSPYLAGRLVSQCWPDRPGWKWMLTIAVATWPALLLGLVTDLGSILDILGAIVGPILGAIAADRLVLRGQWPGPKPGIDLIALTACLCGTLAGLAPYFGSRFGFSLSSEIYPSILAAYAVSFVIVFVARGIRAGSSQVNHKGTG